MYFYADGKLLDTMTKAVPTSPGHITLSHWSTGNPNWSGRPPATDAILTVEYLKGYFNSSDGARQLDWKNRCRDIGSLNATCEVPEVTGAPDGNVSAKTFFFSQQVNMTGNQTVFGGRVKSEGASQDGVELFSLWGSVQAVVLVVSLTTTHLWF